MNKLTNKIKDLKKEIKYKFQRADRGFSDFDIWNFDEKIANEIKQVCFILSEEHHGYPTEFEKLGDKKAEEKWTQILLDISFGFGSYIEMRSGQYIFDDKEYKRLEKEYKKGLKLFTMYHQNLWD